MGWFYGLKLHLVVNDRGELLACQITPGNVDDRKPVPVLCKRLFGKLIADRGYISQPLSASVRAIVGDLQYSTHHASQEEHEKPTDPFRGQVAPTQACHH